MGVLLKASTTFAKLIFHKRAGYIGLNGISCAFTLNFLNSMDVQISTQIFFKFCTMKYIRPNSSKFHWNPDCCKIIASCRLCESMFDFLVLNQICKSWQIASAWITFPIFWVYSNNHVIFLFTLWTAKCSALKLLHNVKLVFRILHWKRYFIIFRSLVRLFLKSL